MTNIYKEHTEFGQYSKYNTDTGCLKQIDEAEFLALKSQPSGGRVFESSLSQTHTGFPRRIYLQITRKCNLQCGYCFIKAGSSEAHLDSEVIYRMAESFGKKGLMEVRLTGGEPTLHPNFFKIYNAFRANNIYVSVATNGLWTKETENFFCNQENLWLIVSIDGSEEIHNKNRTNSYTQIISNLKRVRKKNPGIRLRLNTVLTKENKSCLEHLAWLTKKLNAESITMIPLRPQVREPEALSSMLTPEEFRHVIVEMIAYKKKYGIQFTTTLETEYKQEILPDKIFTKKSSCAAGREGTNVDFDFNRKKLLVYGCSYCPAPDLSIEDEIRKPFIAGELDYDEIEKFSHIWDDDSKWELFRNLHLKSGACKGCNELGTRCTGSCPIQNLDFNSLNMDKDVGLQLKKQLNNTYEWYCYKNIFKE